MGLRTDEDVRRLRDKIVEIFQKVGGPTKPVTLEWLEAAAGVGMIAKDKLEDGAYYYGTCRNAAVAKWDAAKGQFTYMRTKFGTRFPEDIRHPNDDDGFDLFMPVERVEPDDDEVIT